MKPINITEANARVIPCIESGLYEALTISEALGISKQLAYQRLAALKLAGVVEKYPLRYHSNGGGVTSGYKLTGAAYVVKNKTCGNKGPSQIADAFSSHRAGLDDFLKGVIPRVRHPHRQLPLREM